jgi:cyclophilin family peptidyl-prolyl cis-trans isomerase
MAVRAAAQVVRFETSVGSIDMVLNPTNNPRLQGHVDNMLHYIENGNYNGSWINRAGETQSGDDFVLQMGGLFSHTLRPPLTSASTRRVATFDPVRGQPMIAGLSNTRGTVSLALPSGPGGALPDAGTSSFFINLQNNSSLDNAFTVFAAVPDMTVVDRIMALPQQDLTADPLFGEAAGSLTFVDVPVQENGFQVFIERAFVVTDAMAVMSAMGAVQPTIAQAAATNAAGLQTAAVQTVGAGSAASSAVESSNSPIVTVVVPEPAAILIAALGLGCGMLLRRSRRR